MEKDKDGIWQYKELGLDIIYKDGVKIPTKPDQPATVDPAKYLHLKILLNIWRI